MVVVVVKMSKPRRARRVIEKVRDGRTYFLMETPSEGRNKKEAEEFSRWLIDKMGYQDTFIEEIQGFHYVYGNPGITIEELNRLVARFGLIENGWKLLDRIDYGSFSPKPHEKLASIRCAHCGYEWGTKSQMNLVTCPSCGFKTPRVHSR